MILVVSGGRDVRVRPAELVALEWLIKDRGVTTLRVGCCPTGVDADIREWAAEQTAAPWSWEHWMADWKRFGHAGGPTRNRGMVSGDDRLVRSVEFFRGPKTTPRQAGLLLHWPGNRGTIDAIKAAAKLRIKHMAVADVLPAT
jgi:hypothetical protein